MTEFSTTNFANLTQAMRLCAEQAQAEAAARAAARGHYQRSLVDGTALLSGSDLKGRARTYGGRYAESRRALCARLDASGIHWANVGGRLEVGPLATILDAQETQEREARAQAREAALVAKIARAKATARRKAKQGEIALLEWYDWRSRLVQEELGEDPPEALAAALEHRAAATQLGWALSGLGRWIRRSKLRRIVDTLVELLPDQLPMGLEEVIPAEHLARYAAQRDSLREEIQRLIWDLSAGSGWREDHARQILRLEYLRELLKA